MNVTAYIALGSNLGDRHLLLDRAVEALRLVPGVQVVQVSNYCQTIPVGGPPGQGLYLNAAAQLGTSLSPNDLLQQLLHVEKSLGRIRSERFGPRTIDLDLLFYGDLVLHEPDLTLPHPRLHERSFVLTPLAEIAPELVHPVFQRTIHDLLAALPESNIPAFPGKELAGKRALVTGSTSGIGQAIALELARAGAHVLIHGRSKERAEAVAAKCQILGTPSGVLLADLQNPNQGCRLVEQAWQFWNGLDIWINNAGMDTLTGDASRWTFEQKLQGLWEVDVRATMLVSREVGKLMKEGGGGVILTMGWDQAESGMEGDSGQLFAGVKGAVMAFTRSLALSLAPEVRVNCLAPGWIKTSWGEGASLYWQERAKRETPLARWGTPQDVAKTARWLVSPGAEFLTGQMVRVNGGAVR